MSEGAKKTQKVTVNSAVSNNTANVVVSKGSDAVALTNAFNQFATGLMGQVTAAQQAAATMALGNVAAVPTTGGKAPAWLVPALVVAGVWLLAHKKR